MGVDKHEFAQSISLLIWQERDRAVRAFDGPQASAILQIINYF